MQESQDAIYPAEMLKTTPPEGVIMTDVRVDSESREVNRFGLRNMSLGKIRTCEKLTGA